MGLNKVKAGSNMYQFINATWNPLIGKCPHGCIYCSTNKFYYPELIKRYTGEIRLDEKALKDNLGIGNYIFVCAQNDLFAEGVPKEMINRILDHCRKYPKNKYFFQTKNPSKMMYFNLPKETVICTTIESDMFYRHIMVSSLIPYERGKYMEILSDCGYETFVTIEPIMQFNLNILVNLIKVCRPTMVNVGADSGRNNLPEPSRNEIIELISELEKFTKVNIKSNLKKLV
jgi:DNA repair photolyase